MASGTAGSVAVRGARDVPVWLHAFLPPIPLVIEGLTMIPGKEFHDRYFKGEFGFWELGTIALALVAFVYGLGVVFGRDRLEGKTTRILLGLLAFGCFYLAGEEASWGQHVFKWEAGGIWAKVNYQQETNLHNLEYLSITNQLPRLIITLFAVACAFAPLWWRAREKQAAREERWGRIGRWVRGIDPWLVPTGVCVMTALLVLLPPVPKMVGLRSLPEPGETAEFYMALLLAIYLGSIYVRRKSAVMDEE